MAPPRPPKPKLQPKAMVIMMKPMGQAGETPAVGKDIIGMADEFIFPADTSQKALKAEIKNEVIQELRKTETKPTNGGTKFGMHGNYLKLVEQRTESLLQTGSSGSPGGKQVGNLAAGSDAQALGGLTKQNFHGAGHAQC